MRKEHNYYVYIVRCSDGTYYTGVTNSYERRVRQDNEGIDRFSYTYPRRPVTLVYTAHFQDIYEAIHWEKQVKGWSRKKKEALIRRAYEELPELSRKNFGK